MRRNEAQRDSVCAAHAAVIHHALSGSDPDLYAIGRECGALAAPLPWHGRPRWHQRAMARSCHVPGVTGRSRRLRVTLYP
eukprot:1997802-Prymnesium_polylepis.1